ncbi:MAG TPA: ATP synthase F1 subunit delta [Planctomycetota bacterium]|nr:ATP synthase F1 subunit delta [Planctomycetota bacterium]
MIDPVVAKRYAEALFLAARDANAVADVEVDLAVVGAAVAGEQVAAALDDPTLDVREKRARVLDPIASKLRSPLVRNVIALALDRRREAVLPRLPEAFHRLALEARGEAEGVVESATPLPAEALSAISEAIGRTLGRRMKLTPRVSPGLIGGLRVTVGSRRYDASVVSRLAQLRGRMLAAPLPTP